MRAQTFRCCPHCADDKPHIEKDTHEVPCTLCYGDVERHTAAIAEAAREYVAAIRSHEGAWPSLKTKLAVWDTKEALIAAVDAERAEREGKS